MPNNWKRFFSWPSLLAPALWLLIFGLVPALIIAFLFRVDEGRLLVLGNPVGDFDPVRVFAGLLSTAQPILWMIPPALVIAAERRGLLFWLSCFLAPCLLLAPTVAALYFSAGSAEPRLVTALMGLSVFCLCFCLWMEWLRRGFRWAGALLVYGFFWAVSAFMQYLDAYVLPYLDLPGLAWVTYLRFLMPQIGAAGEITDGILAAEGAGLTPLLPTLIQVPLLAILLFFLDKRGRLADEIDVPE